MSDPSIKCRTFGDIISIIERRGRIKGSVETVDRDLIKGFINEYYVKICGYRKWQWRNCDRTFTISTALESSTVAPIKNVDVVSGSRIITFNGLTLDNTFIGRSIKFNDQVELLRIIGVNIATGEAYLEAPYPEDTETAASYKIYKYEFALPPDCDTPNQLYVMRDSYTPEGELEYKSLLEFNRMISTYSSLQTVPKYYCVDGKTYANLDLPPLDETILDWDFLGGTDTDKVEKIRIYPIESDKRRVIHMSYTLLVKEMSENDDEPLLPIDSRWLLVHYALYEWFKQNGQIITASKELKDAENMLQLMTNDYRKTQTKPKFIVDARGGHREHIYGRGKRLLNISG